MNAPEAIQKRRPIIHCLTSPVSSNDVANALLAIGASPIMAEDACESAEVTAQADALLLNLGMPGPGKLEAMLRSGRAARERGIPVVFDPVGVPLTAFRQQAASRILSEVRPGIIRGNFSEISHLAGQATSSHGVDTGEPPSFVQLAQAIARAEAVSRAYGAVTVLTGEHDIVTDGQRTEIRAGGSIWLTRMTGAGCILGGLIAAFAAVAPRIAPPEPAALSEPAVPTEPAAPAEPTAPADFIAPVMEALQHFAAAARAAECRVLESGGGSGSFRVFLIDALGCTGPSVIEPSAIAAAPDECPPSGGFPCP